MKVVNLRFEEYDVLGCRGTIFGNPYTHIKSKKTLAKFVVDTREESIDCFKKYFYEKVEREPEFKKAVLELKDKRVGCYCNPLPCHLNIIKEYIENENKDS